MLNLLILGFVVAIAAPISNINLLLKYYLLYDIDSIRYIYNKFHPVRICLQPGILELFQNEQQLVDQ